MKQQDYNIQPPKEDIPVLLVAHPVEANEIDIFDMFCTLARQRLLIAGFVIAATLLGGLYALLATPIYRASITLAPPSIQDLQSLLVISDYFKPNVLFSKFSQAMLNKKGRDILSETVPGEPEWGNGTLSISGPDPKQLADTLNSFVTNREKSIRAHMMDERSTELQIRIFKLEQQIKSMLAEDENRRLNWIAELQNALLIARQLRIVDYQLPSATSRSNSENSNVSIATGNIPLYMRGTKSLQAELSSLKNLDAASLPSPEVFNRQQQIEKLREQLSIKPSDFRMMRVDEPAQIPSHPFKSKRTMIIMVSLLLGTALGILAAFIREALARSRKGQQA